MILSDNIEMLLKELGVPREQLAVNVVRNYGEDESRSLGTVLQEMVSNRLEWLLSKALVLSVKLKGLSLKRSGKD